MLSLNGPPSGGFRVLRPRRGGCQSVVIIRRAVARVSKIVASEASQSSATRLAIVGDEDGHARRSNSRAAADEVDDLDAVAVF